MDKSLAAFSFFLLILISILAIITFGIASNNRGTLEFEYDSKRALEREVFSLTKRVEKLESDNTEPDGANLWEDGDTFEAKYSFTINLEDETMTIREVRQ